MAALMRGVAAAPVTKALVAGAVVVAVACGSTKVYVRFVNASPALHPILMLDARVGGVCRNDAIYKGLVAGSILLGKVSLSRKCSVEAVGFALERGAYIAPAAAFTNAVATSPHILNVTFPEVTVVPVTLWYVAPTGGVLSVEQQEQVADAIDVYPRLRTGIALNILPRRVDPGTTAATLMKTGCDDATALQATGTYDPNVINAYFPAADWTDEVWLFGWHCGDGMLYVWRGASIGILAHEIGHALLGQDHVDGIAGLTDLNLMWASPGLDDISLGQTYRLNFGDLSWLNRPSVAPGRPLVKTCQTDPVLTRPCPRLALQSSWP